MISPLLTTDDAVMLQTVTSRRNEGNRYRALGILLHDVAIRRIREEVTL